MLVGDREGIQTTKNTCHLS